MTETSSLTTDALVVSDGRRSHSGSANSLPNNPCNSATTTLAFLSLITSKAVVFLSSDAAMQVEVTTGDKRMGIQNHHMYLPISTVAVACIG